VFKNILIVFNDYVKRNFANSMYNLRNYKMKNVFIYENVMGGKNTQVFWDFNWWRFV